ncbi:MAG TPA: ABC transporter permease [Thermomicrobiales bacterium]|nr:ABC transporter permease [Thermomicrobiales bacterium]
MFFVSYVFAELRRRRGRTILTALGLAVGVALVIAVNALSTGLDRAQAKVLEPLTGVGTDMSVTRPIKITQGGGGPFGNLSRSEQRRLRNEQGGGGPLNFRDLKPGSKVDQDSFQASQLSFSQSQVAKTEQLPGVAGAAGALTLNDVHIHGKAPKIQLDQGSGQSGQGSQGPPAGGSFGNSSLHFDSRSVTGIDQTKSDLAAVTPSQIVKGHFFASGAAGATQAILSSSYANTNKISVGDTITLDNHDFTVVGIASSPLGGTASDIYVQLAKLQKISGYKNQINTLQVRATSTSTVTSVAREIKQSLKSSEVTTAQSLAKRVSGSLTDTKNLSSKLGTGLEVVGLLAAVLIASLLALSSVAKRTRELGTLKAIGWSSFQVVRQIASESVLQGLLGGAIGIVLGLVGVYAINAIDWTLKATVAGSNANQAGPGTGGGPFGFGQTAVTSGSTLVKITTSADAKLILVAVCLAVLGGLVAGVAGGLRAARLRPAAALRTVE